MAGKNAKTYQLTTPPASAPRESQAASLTAFAPAADKPLNIRVLTTPFIAPGSLPDGTRIVGKVIEFRDSPKKDYKGRVMLMEAQDGRTRVLFPVTASVGYALRDYAQIPAGQKDGFEAAEKKALGKTFAIEKLGVKPLAGGKTRTLFAVGVVE